MTLTNRNAALSAILGPPLDPQMVASLFRATGAEQAGGILLEAARELSGADEVFAYRRVGQSLPQVVLSRSQLPGVKRRCRLYTGRYHIDDPVPLAQGAIEWGGFMRRVSAEEILRDDYRAVCFEEPGFIEKLCFGWRSVTETTVISFYRRSSGSNVNLVSLSALASIGLFVVRQLAPSQHTPDQLIHTIEAAMTRLFPQLSQREKQVCARTVAGWTAKQIGGSLGIKRGTVLTYRQRAYQRFGFQGATNFLHGLLH